jgi:nitrite reductase/ring-hydroxylating ferredoxin subunit
LEWVARAISVACAGIVGVPAARYLIDPLRRRPSAQRDFKRIVRLDALPIGLPREFAVRDMRQDAWTLYPEETIGRVWLVRRTNEATPPEQATVDVFATVCPHLGCAIQLDSAGKKFVCPCHQAGFRLSGERMGEQELGHKNPAPRAMDTLDCRINQDEATQQWWVEVRFQKFQQGLTMKVPVA